MSCPSPYLVWRGKHSPLISHCAIQYIENAPKTHRKPEYSHPQIPCAVMTGCSLHIKLPIFDICWNTSKIYRAPENSLSLIRNLVTFSKRNIKAPLFWGILFEPGIKFWVSGSQELNSGVARHVVFWDQVSLSLLELFVVDNFVNGPWVEKVVYGGHIKVPESQKESPRPNQAMWQHMSPYVVALHIGLCPALSKDIKIFSDIIWKFQGHPWVWLPSPVIRIDATKVQPGWATKHFQALDHIIFS